MKALVEYIEESSKISSLDDYIKEAASKFFIIKDKDGNDVEVKQSRFKRVNQAMEWICRHCILGPEPFMKNETDRMAFKTNAYELNSVNFCIIPKDKDLANVHKVTYDNESVSAKYKNTEIKDDEIIGELVPFHFRSPAGVWTEIVLTDKGIISARVRDCPVWISKENVFK